MDSVEHSQALAADINWLMRFKKTRESEPISETMIDGFEVTVADSCVRLHENAKIIRAMTCSKGSAE